MRIIPLKLIYFNRGAPPPGRSTPSKNRTQPTTPKRPSLIQKSSTRIRSSQRGKKRINRSFTTKVNRDGKKIVATRVAQLLPGARAAHEKKSVHVAHTKPSIRPLPSARRGR